MPKPRTQQVSLEASPYYYCVSRYVRSTFLCGTDAATGKVYDYRPHWIKEKILALAEIFFLDVYTYAVMSNHYHVVLHIDQAQADLWENDEVVHDSIGFFQMFYFLSALRMEKPSHPMNSRRKKNELMNGTYIFVHTCKNLAV